MPFRAHTFTHHNNLRVERDRSVQLEQTPHATERHWIIPRMQQAYHLSRDADGLLERREHQVLGLLLRTTFQKLMLVERLPRNSMSTDKT